MQRQLFGKFTVRRLALIGVALAALVFVTLAALVTASTPATAQLSAALWVDAPSATLTGRDIAVNGGITADDDLSGAVVKISKREIGESTDTYVADATVTYNMATGNVFRAVIPAVTRSCVITATWEGNDGYLASSTWMFAGVKPKLTLQVKAATRGKTKFRVVVAPEQPSHRQGMTRPEFIADVQCRVHGVWKRFPAELGEAGTNGTSWCTYVYYDVKPGRYPVRAQFAGTNDNVARFSVPQPIVVR